MSPYLYRFMLAVLSSVALWVACISKEVAIGLPVRVQLRSAQELSTEAEDLFKQGIQQFQFSQFRAALQSWQQVLEIAQQLNDPSLELKTIGNLGLAHAAIGEYSQARALQQQALKLSREIHDRQAETNALGNLGNLYNALGQPVQAIELYQQQLTLSKEIGDSGGEAKALGNLGQAYRALGQYTQAIQFYQQTLPLAKTLGDRGLVANTLNDLGIVYLLQGHYLQATDLHQQALTIYRENGDLQGEVKVFGNLGNVYFAQGQYLQAIQFHQQALTIAKEIGDRSLTATSLGNLGTVYQFLGDYQQAIEFHQQMLSIAREIGDLGGEARGLGSLGIAYSSLKQYQKAIIFYEQFLSIVRENGDRRLEGIALNNLGEVYREQEQFQQAKNFYQQSLDIARSIGNRQGEAIVLGNLGLTFAALKQFQEATAFHFQALAIKREIGERAEEGVTLSEIAQALASQNQPELAILFYKQSVNITEIIRHDLRSLPQALQQAYTESVSENYRRLANLLLQQDRVLEAQQVLDLLKVQELDDYLRGVRGTGQQLVVLRPEQEILAKYNALQQSAIDLGRERSRLQQRLGQGESLSASEQQRLDQLLQLETDLNRQFNQFSSSADIVALLEKLSPIVLRQSLPLEDLVALQDDLKSLNAMLLYPLILEDRLELVITTPNAPPLRRTVNVSKAKLNRAILAFRQALQNPNSDATQPAQQLYNWLIKPIEADLAQSNVQTIIYAPDGQLRYIPLAALYDSKQPDGKQWLVQRYRINNITAKSLTNLDRQASAQPHILAGAFADPNITYNIRVGQQQEAFRGLPFAGQEVKNLIRSFPDTTSLVDRNFSLAATSVP